MLFRSRPPAAVKSIGLITAWTRMCRQPAAIPTAVFNPMGSISFEKGVFTYDRDTAVKSGESEEIL